MELPRPMQSCRNKWNASWMGFFLLYMSVVWWQKIFLNWNTYLQCFVLTKEKTNPNRSVFVSIHLEINSFDRNGARDQQNQSILGCGVHRFCSPTFTVVAVHDIQWLTERLVLYHPSVKIQVWRYPISPAKSTPFALFSFSSLPLKRRELSEFCSSGWTRPLVPAAPMDVNLPTSVTAYECYPTPKDCKLAVHGGSEVLGLCGQISSWLLT